MEVVHNNKIQSDNKIHIFCVYCLIKVLQEDNDDRIMQDRVKKHFAVMPICRSVAVVNTVSMAIHPAFLCM